MSCNVKWEFGGILEPFAALAGVVPRKRRAHSLAPTLSSAAEVVGVHSPYPFSPVAGAPLLHLAESRPRARATCVRPSDGRRALVLVLTGAVQLLTPPRTPAGLAQHLRYKIPLDKLVPRLSVITLLSSLQPTTTAAFP
jgi:hypothetical protein